MFKRDIEIHDDLDVLDVSNLRSMLSNTNDDNKIKELCAKLADLDTVTKHISSSTRI